MSALRLKIRRCRTMPKRIQIEAFCRNVGQYSLKIRIFSEDRKSTRLNSSHGYISYAVFCLKKKKKKPLPPSVRGAALSALSSAPAIIHLAARSPPRAHYIAQSELTSPALPPPHRYLISRG